jgi:hypothetical protein
VGGFLRPSVPHISPTAIRVHILRLFRSMRSNSTRPPPPPPRRRLRQCPLLAFRFHPGPTRRARPTIGHRQCRCRIRRVMQPPGPPLATPQPLPPAVAAELAQLESRLGQVAGEPARHELAELGEVAAVRVLRRIARSQEQVRTLTGYIVSAAVQETFALNAQAVPTAESRACNSSAPSLSGEARLTRWPHSS